MTCLRLARRGVIACRFVILPFGARKCLVCAEKPHLEKLRTSIFLHDSFNLVKFGHTLKPFSTKLIGQAGQGRLR